MRRILLILLLLLCGAGPAQKRLLLQGGEVSDEQFIRNLGPTLWLDGNDTRFVTATSTAVSAWTSKYGAVSFTAAGAAQPVTTRRDNRENTIYYSADLSNTTYWVRSALDSVTAQTDPDGGTSAWRFLVNATDATHRVTSSATYAFPVVSGQQYVFTSWMKKTAGARPSVYLDIVGTGFDAGGSLNLDTGATSVPWTSGTSARTLSMVDGGSGWWITTFTFTASVTSSLRAHFYFGATDAYAGAGESYDIYAPQMRSALADSTYIPTTYPQYRGINGRQAIRFDGVGNVLASATAASAIMGVGEKIIFMAARSPVASVGGNQYVFADSASKIILYRVSSTGYLRWYNDDGGADYAQQLLLANSPFVVKGTHSASLLRFGYNKNLLTTAASGDTSSLAGTLTLGGGAGSFFNGDIGELLVANKNIGTTSEARVNRYLCRKWGADC